MPRPNKAEPPVQPDAPEDALQFDLVGRGMTQWRAERPDIDCSGKAIVGRIVMLQDIIMRRANAALARHGLRYPVYAVMATLRVAGKPYRMSPSQLQETLLFTSGGISNLLARVEQQGYIRRSIDPDDKRGVRVELTREGLQVIGPAMEDYAASEIAVCRSLPPDEQAAIARLLGRMIRDGSGE